MSLYFRYIKERGVKDVVESDDGFATFVISGTECYIEDIYVIPEQRKSKIAASMANEIAEIAKAKGCKYLTGRVVPSAKGATESCQVLFAYGFKLLKAQDNFIIFSKEI